MMYDTIIIGAGPAGLFAADTLSSKGQKVLIVDKGLDIKERVCYNSSINKSKCHNCNPCRIYSGLGGAGGKSDGKLNFHPQIGGDLTEFMSEEQAYFYMDIVNKRLGSFGCTKEYVAKAEDTKYLVKEAAKLGMKYIPIDQKHIGSDLLVGIITNFRRELEEKKADFLLETEVQDLIVKNEKVKGVKIKGKSIHSKNVIIATGRAGESWFIGLAKKHDIKLEYRPIDIGVRIETLNEIMQDMPYDPKIHIIAPTFNEQVRTFCCNPSGFVVREKLDHYSIVNGHALSNKKSQNTNFALLNTIKLTDPLEDTYRYGSSLAHLADTLGGGKPILQTLGALKAHRRSKKSDLERSFVKPTLMDVTLGDISMMLPFRIVTNILEALERLSNLIPGLYEDNNTLIYAPEIKFKSMSGEII